MAFRAIYIILIMFMMTTSYSFSQSFFNTQHFKNTYLIPEENHLDFGFYNTIPTSSILFEDSNPSNNGVLKETLSNEWNVPRRPGIYLELSKNIGSVRPIFIGVGIRTQTLFNYKKTQYTNPFLNGDNFQKIKWTYNNRARLIDYRLFGEYSLFYRDNWSIFARGDVGLSHYFHKADIEWRGTHWDSEKNSENVTLARNNSLSFNFDLGLGFRWQFDESFALRAHIGYQFQTPTDFLRFDQIAGKKAELNKSGPLPEDSDFSLIKSEQEFRPLKMQYQHLNAQIGISMALDGSFRAKKPILYLYPEDTTDVNIDIALHDQEFIFTYPYYQEGGWNVRAYPGGKIFDYDTERNYYSIFWETEGAPMAENLEEGFVVEGGDTRAFLEEKLETLGLNYKEANEFLIFWLPYLEGNKYNAIYFAFDEYEASSELKINPSPDTVIRIMMLWEPLDEKIELKKQMLPDQPKREGFTAVEWGGTEGKFFKSGNDFSIY